MEFSLHEGLGEQGGLAQGCCGLPARHALLGENAGKWRAPQKTTVKLPASCNSKLVANTCLGKTVPEGKMSQTYKLTPCFSRMGRTSISGVLYILSHWVFAIIPNCSFYYPLLHRWAHWGSKRIQECHKDPQLRFAGVDYKIPTSSSNAKVFTHPLNNYL